MSKLLKNLLQFRALLMLFIGVILSPLLFTQTVFAGPTRLGGLNLDGYCRSINQGGVMLTNNTWVCQSGQTVNMDSACQWQYPNQNAVSQQETPGNPYTWACYQLDTTTPTVTSNPSPTITPNPPTPTNAPTSSPTPTPTLRNTLTPTPTVVPTSTTTRLGGMNIDAYCRNLNQGGAVLSNNTWTCSSGQTVNMNAECQWQYALSTAFAVQEIAGNPYTWACYNSTTVSPTPTLTPTARLTVTPTLTPTPSLTATLTPTLTPTSSATPTPVPSRARKNIYSMTTTEYQRFVNAVNTLRADGRYADFMNRHIQAMMTETPPNDPTTDRNVAHRGPAFLAWHRAFIYEFEDELRSVDPTVTIPYWQFENETPGVLPRVFTTSYFGGDGNRTQGDRVIDGPFASWNIIRRIARDPDSRQTALPSTADVNTAMQLTFYENSPWSEFANGFNVIMEGWIGNNAPYNLHNRVHGYIGGDMNTMGAANDPIFFLVHANIDRIWAQWQQRNGITNYQPTSGGPAGHNLNDIMRFLLRSATPANVLDSQRSMGYIYN